MKKVLLLVVLFIAQSSFAPKPITWVAIGDSITYLNDHQNETGNRVTKGYMTSLQEKIPQLQFTNKEYNAWTAIRIATQLEKHALQKAVWSI